jgi:trigger factor
MTTGFAVLGSLRAAHMFYDPGGAFGRGARGKPIMAMQIVEKSGEGLSRVYGVTVPVQDLLEKLDAKLAEVRPQVNLKGFRPGKVPLAHVKKMYGKSMMGEIVQQALDDSQAQAMSDAKVRPAAQPDVKMESDVEKLLSGQADLAYELSVEVMPDFEPVDLSTVALKRPVHTPSEADVDAQLQELVDQNKSYEAKDGEAADGDMVVADFVGRIDGEVFEGGSAEAAEIVIGSGRFIPGFEAQLSGAKAGDTVLVKVAFPDDYGAEQLQGKAAEFDVTVKEVRGPQAAVGDDAFATRIGFETLASLKDAIRTQLSQQYQGASRYKAKRALLDVLDGKHDFPLPPRMVESEFNVIWSQVEQERTSGELSPEDEGKSEEQLKTEYRKIAERRVRLGLVLAEIGQRNNVQVTDQEMQNVLMQEARRYPGQEKEIFDFYRANPQAAAQLRAPIYEEKVVDLILGRAKVEDEQVSKEDLFADDEMPEGYGDASKTTAGLKTEAQGETAAEAEAQPQVQTSKAETAAEPAEAMPQTEMFEAAAAPAAAEPAADAEPSAPAKKPRKKAAPKAAADEPADAE